MTDESIDLPPWEPPLAGSEAEQLTGALNRLRWTFRWKVDGLDSAGLSFRFASSALSLGGLMLHLAAVEALRFSVELDNSDAGEPWDSLWERGWPDNVFKNASDYSPAELYALYDEVVQTSQRRLTRALAAGGLEQPSALATPDGAEVSLRRLVFDLVEEYGRHTGHADLLREAVDGRIGEDPPPTWRPESGQWLLT